jgi:hypothetical protein
MADLTLVVITLSSIYSAVPSCFEVEAQPMKDINKTDKKNAEKYLSCFMAKFSKLRRKPSFPKFVREGS